MKQFAVVGHPIEQSRSPELHQAFAEKTGIVLNYQKILAPLDAFQNTVQNFFNDGGIGLNITVPFKEQAFGLCQHLSERALIAGAVNTLWMQNGQLHGDNTDGQGLVSAIENLNWPLKHTRVLILGAGGATRGVIYPLLHAGVSHITIANRTLSRAETLIANLAQTSPKIANALNAVALNDLAGDFDIVINATSASLSGETLQLPESLQFKYAYEMAYGKASSFLDEAQKRGVPFADGFGMLLGQAIESFEIWNGVRPYLSDFLYLAKA
ncbi:MAG: shikimate dehydrogenase [Acinetobacter sp.]